MAAACPKAAVGIGHSNPSAAADQQFFRPLGLRRWPEKEDFLLGFGDGSG
jgi:hypothetical protein